MQLTKLFQLQKTLDQRIESEHGLEGISLLPKKILALQVEIGELANETRCFKFWSAKKPSGTEVILEEYVDCLHFILSIGLEKGFCDVTPQMKPINEALSEQFLNFLINITDFVICTSKENYENLFENFLGLGHTLGFTEEGIEVAYLKKNHINHQRQNEGY